MCGFRVAFGGAQQLYSVTADLVTYGKIIGAGLPVGAYGGKKEIMEYVAPTGPVYQAGTLSGNPLAMTAGLTLLRKLKTNPSIYQELEKKSAYLEQGIKEVLTETGITFTLHRVGSMLGVFFCDEPVISFEDANRTNQTLFKSLFHYMLKRGIYIPPSPFEAFFLSNALSYKDLDFTIIALLKSIKELAVK